jgi:hypothetical protein
MLLQLRKEIDMDNKNTVAAVATREPEKPKSNADLIEKLRGIRDARRFDKNRFHQLEEREASTSGLNATE